MQRTTAFLLFLNACSVLWHRPDKQSSTPIDQNQMIPKRTIRPDEVALIHHLLRLANLPLEDFTITDQVEEYEGGVMGSIGLGHPDATYVGDIIQVEYIDTDQTPVIITLTKDDKNRLLDLDFWKMDFSKLLTYPTPEKVTVKNQG